MSKLKANEALLKKASEFFSATIKNAPTKDTKHFKSGMKELGDAIASGDVDKVTGIMKQTGNAGRAKKAAAAAVPAKEASTIVKGRKRSLRNDKDVIYSGREGIPSVDSIF
jgi:hypothetical protein